MLTYVGSFGLVVKSDAAGSLSSLNRARGTFGMKLVDEWIRSICDLYLPEYAASVRTDHPYWSRVLSDALCSISLAITSTWPA